MIVMEVIYHLLVFHYSLRLALLFLFATVGAVKVMYYNISTGESGAATGFLPVDDFFCCQVNPTAAVLGTCCKMTF